MTRYADPKSIRELPKKPLVDQFGNARYTPPPASQDDNAPARGGQLTDIPRYMPQHASEGWLGKIKDGFGKLFWYLTE